ncbi:pao retrotransposon peptidase domain-containing protein [Phthorimaea operculella]|nr:pao retrotransposon peptidase domain-containing protein [Phthorimaea operculella]
MAFMGRPPYQQEWDPYTEVLQRFWESEEPPTADRRKPEDDKCELFYQYNTARCPSGRFVTRLPFLPNRPALGSYELRKWLSSCPELLAGLPGEFHQDPHLFENPDNPNTLGILGVQYRPTHDVFTYKIEPDLLEKTWTKRLWLANLGWDDQLSGELLKDWLKFVTTLPGIVHIAIPRKLVPSVGCKATLHGFCDASERGYAAAVYLRTASSTGTVHVRLVMAKSKVAPVRTRWTIPKLELAGAALLARLLNHVTCNLRGTINLDETVYAWTDSRIVLCWLQTSVHTLEVFVANRVSQITGSETPLVWRHVPGEWNPADCASRGCRAPDLVSHPLWWGPQWLTESPQEWPFNECRAPLGPPDRGLRVNVGQLVPKPNPAFLLERYSSLDKLLGVTGWIKRFVNNCRKPQAERNFTPVLSPAERNAALCSLVRVVQAEHFEEEVRLLRDGRGKLKGGIVRLNPFLDEQGMLRVGGRLRNASLPFSARHPLLLQKGDP